MTSKRIVVSGASGLVGGHLVPCLEASGYEVTRLVRREANGPGESQWNPASGILDAKALEGAHAIVNLSGVSIAGKRWSETRKHEIRASRLEATGLLARTVAGLSEKPAVFVSTSAVGYYGEGGNNVLTEQSPKGEGFLADVCQEWEAAAVPAEIAGVRVVHPRFGIVLAPEGGMLAQLKRIFGMGFGGRIGSGEQYMSWIDIDDLARAIGFLIANPHLHGPVNAVAPGPVTNRLFTDVLGSALGRPTVLPAPAFAVRTMMGQMADELVLVSQHAVPARLLDAGFEFKAATLKCSLERQLRSPKTTAASSAAMRAA